MAQHRLEPVLSFLEDNPSCTTLPDALLSAARAAMTDRTRSDSEKFNEVWLPILKRTPPHWLRFFLKMVPDMGHRDVALARTLAHTLNTESSPAHTPDLRRAKLCVLLEIAPNVTLSWHDYELMWDTPETSVQMWSEIIPRVPMTDQLGQNLLRAIMTCHLTRSHPHPASAQEVAACLSHVFDAALAQAPHIDDDMIDPIPAVAEALSIIVFDAPTPSPGRSCRGHILVSLQQINPACITSVLMHTVKMFKLNPDAPCFGVLIDDMLGVCSERDIQRALTALSKYALPPGLASRATAQALSVNISPPPKDAHSKRM